MTRIIAIPCRPHSLEAYMAVPKVAVEGDVESDAYIALRVQGPK